MKIFYTVAPVDSREFLKEILRGEYGVSAPHISRTENGKPVLLNAPLFFNLSHSGGITALAVGSKEVGLDIQRRTNRAFPAIRRRLAPAEKTEDFFRLWTAKEAYVKYRGETLANLLSALVFKDGTLFENGKPVSAHLEFAELENCTLCLCTEQAVTVELIKL